MDIKNIIVYSNGFPPDKVGGMESNAYFFVEYLFSRSAFNVGVLSQTGKLFERRRSVGFKSGSLDIRVAKKKRFKDQASVVRLFREFNFEPSETVIFHNSLDLHHFYSDLKEAGYAQVARSGGNDIFFMRKTEAGRKQFLPNLGVLAKLFVNSQYSLGRCLEIGLPMSLLEVVKGGCDIGKACGTVSLDCIPHGKKIILTCGRLVDFKGLDDAIDVMALLRSKREDYFFLIVGSGEAEESLKAHAKARGVDDLCCFYGQVDPEVLPELYSAADIYLSCSKGVRRTYGEYSYIHTETMGRSICEAQANGLPVVVTDAGGCPEMVSDQVTGFVIPEGDTQQVSEVLCRLLADPDLAARLGDAGRKHIESQFLWESVFSSYVKVISQL